MSVVMDLREVIYALSDALDLVGIDDIAHGKRVGIMAAECARVLGLPAAERTRLFDLGLLHDIGVSSTRVHRELVGQFDWEGAQEHCRVGAERLAAFEPLAALAPMVRYHHTHWLHLPATLDAECAQWTNLIYLVDRVDALAAPYYGDDHLLPQVAQLRAAIAQHAGEAFCPDLVEVFMAASAAEAFWLQLEARSIEGYMLDMRAGGTPYQASLAELRALAAIFSRIVDAKSPFTAEHSLGVARLARFLAETLGISREHCDKLEIAGLLHDLGKLRVPDEILDKPGQLEAQERLIINTHSFETYRILRRIPGFEEIAPWAAYHHEEPGGGGYPFRIDASVLPIEARILRVADIFQAMVQDRPYRAGLAATQAFEFIEALRRQGRVDAEVVVVLGTRLDEAYRLARPAAMA
ncbi:HD-GYP domain-containing protein [Plasticicumulans acidivorans]|uniref:Putative nucleotidyltransferase with HDIG domain n=1 Tax=Plasticicumulans acidivorans TaxID=886464 RepID=A0A317N021_9GAMM|nr:HD domain-containing phosphohydrolase [Plasticicumulans acidivorans]PWV65807.1 putative nucleotidyltransferase with HDIG domain [Plasticicumulans acidivorans]